MFYNNGKEFRKFTDIVDVRKYKIISIVGGGGKTTTLNSISQFYIYNKIPHIVMTTTNMMYPNENVYDDIDLIKEALLNDSRVYVGKKVIKNSYKKLSPPDFNLLNKIIDQLDIPIIIEADGAKCKPIKINRDYEPVIIEKTDLVISVVGIDSIGKRISEIVARPSDICDFLQKDENYILNLDDVYKIITSKNGIYKNIGPSMQSITLINKCDNNKLLDLAKKLNNKLVDDGHNVIYGSFLVN